MRGGSVLYLLIRQVYPFSAVFLELSPHSGTKVGGTSEDIFMGSENTLIRTHDQGDNGTGERAEKLLVSNSFPNNKHIKQLTFPKKSRPNSPATSPSRARYISSYSA